MESAVPRRAQSPADEFRNRSIRQQMEMRVWYYAQNPDRIEERLRELDQEWDMKRSLETVAASLALGGTLFGLFSRKYLLLPLMAGGFLMQHALQGWCPPIACFRRLGVRTQAEIEAERYALKALRGDFEKSSAGEVGERAQRTLGVVGEEVPVPEMRH